MRWLFAIAASEQRKGLFHEQKNPPRLLLQDGSSSSSGKGVASMDLTDEKAGGGSSTAGGSAAKAPADSAATTQVKSEPRERKHSSAGATDADGDADMQAHGGQGQGQGAEDGWAGDEEGGGSEYDSVLHEILENIKARCCDAALVLCLSVALYCCCVVRVVWVLGVGWQARLP